MTVKIHCTVGLLLHLELAMGLSIKELQCTDLSMIDRCTLPAAVLGRWDTSQASCHRGLRPRHS